MTRAALYTRVSTSEQAQEGFSLAAQMARLRAYATAQGWIVSGEYVDDGHSGCTVRRPAYAQMLQEADNWDVIVVLKMDRIHRNSKNFMGMMEILEAADKQFASVTESFDTSTAMGRFVMDTIQRIAQLESEVIGERVTDGMTQKAKEGAGGLGGPAPYGYRWENKMLVVVPEEAAVVRMVHGMAWKGVLSMAIATTLNQQGHRTRLGKQWTYWSVANILNAPVYQGHLLWAGIVQKNCHEAIVPELAGSQEKRAEQSAGNPSDSADQSITSAGPSAPNTPASAPIVKVEVPDGTR